jgi:co-chaperonin GroES (HSP10)
MTTLQPINDNIIIKLPAVEKELKTNSGIVLATTSAG